MTTTAKRADRRAAEREQMKRALEALRTSEGWRRWLGVRRHFRAYSLHNQLLIAHQRLGYALRRGEGTERSRPLRGRPSTVSEALLQWPASAGGG